MRYPLGRRRCSLAPPPQVLPATTVRMHAVISTIRLHLGFIEHAQHLSLRLHWTTTTHPQRTTVGWQSGWEHVSGSGSTAAARWPPLLMQMVTVPTVASVLNSDSRAASRQGLTANTPMAHGGPRYACWSWTCGWRLLRRNCADPAPACRWPWWMRLSE